MIVVNYWYLCFDVFGRNSVFFIGVRFGFGWCGSGSGNCSE